MPDLQNLLDQVYRLDQQATKGPWTTDSTPDEFGIIWGAVEQIGGGFGERAMVTEVVEEHADAEFIALARTALPQLAIALRAVMELHRPFDWSFSAGDQVYTITSCQECARLGADEEDAIYPCPTMQAITDAMEGDDAG